ncbi:MAG: leucine-rich repeat domain-containing protein [Acutalibacteraceae bacterium]|nr:leucine-rich repeat domain-containing protein [Acutalibacteraceae bacterium]
MKKLLAILMIGILAVSCTACGEESSTDDTKGNSKTSSTKDSGTSADEADSEESEENNNADSGEITMEAVLSQAVSPEGDFKFSKDEEGNRGVVSYKGSDSIVVIPDSYEGAPVTKINKYSFSDKNSEKAIKCSDSVVEIEQLACALNDGLEIVVMGANTKTIGEGAFLQCSALREVKLNDGLEVIVTQAFASCHKLKSITIPESVTTIEPGAFYGINDTIVIHGKAGSAAEEYAKSENIQFVAE